jgi:hypothetical protein
MQENAIKFLLLPRGINQKQEKSMARRAFLTRMAQLAALPFLTAGTADSPRNSSRF